VTEENANEVESVKMEMVVVVVGVKTAVRSEESTRIGQRWLWVAFIRWEKSGNQLEV